ncbi:unnamed protein product [Cercopithifilaria johnstoni]|uniref:Nucleolar protein 14 n=1 Tax=Cercopithifilaria johnstoni TaxID=2874296 RepID=A0A8J2PUE6_9BILA|nr:unnamed protein product [Cercopithifilaria johnstoni]
MVKKMNNGKVRETAGQAMKINQFELKYNRAKHKILGTKALSAPCGAPGLSKKKAFENRAKTLAIEWKERGKRNKIIDQRIGEGNSMMDNEERILKRFTEERLKIFKTTNSELTNDGDEKLTHRGRELTEVGRYDRTMLSDEDNDDEMRGGGNIDSNIVAAVHFGGGFEASTENTAIKRQDFIAELIAKTRQQRYDKKLARDEYEDATERLDEMWNKIQQTGAMTSFVKPTKDKLNISRDEKDDYDHLFYELRMDSGKRGEATEPQKIEKEKANENREKLIRQEKTRLAKMDQDKEAKKKSKSDGNKNIFMVKYDSSGALMNIEKLKKGRIKVVRIGSSDEEDETNSEEMDEDKEKDDFDAMVNGVDQTDLPQSSTRDTGINAETEIRKGSENGELPFVIDLPQKYENLKKLLSAQNDANTEVIIKRLIELYHPSLCEGNKSRLGRLFILLLRYYDDLSKESVAKIAPFGYLVRALYFLMKFDVEHSARCMRALLRQQYALHARAPREMFTFRFVAFLKLVSTLYPMHDTFHPVVSPSLAFACRLVSTARMCSIKDVARMLSMTGMLGSFVEESKRYLPEVIAFLHGVFLMAIESRDDERSPATTFPISLPHRRMLFITDDCSMIEITAQLDATEVFSDDKDRPLIGLLSRLPRNLYPTQLLEKLSELESFITAQFTRNLLKQLQRPVKQKKMLDLLEPCFEENYNAEKAHHNKNVAKKSKKVEIKQLTKKYKRELRGTVRELRRDNQFLNREKRQEMLENDKVRKKKTKWLISTLQGQESEYKKNIYMKHKL